MSKVLVIVGCLLLAGCESARNIRAIAYCAANQYDINRRCS